MIPILYNSAETEFATQGLGALSDAISCYVTEERNGVYELEMEYPQTGIHFEDIQNGNIIMAIPSPYRAAQPFRIYKITKPLNGNVTIYAYHISYDLNKIPVSPCQASGVASAMEAIKANMEIDNNFQFWTDKTTAADFVLSVPTACRTALGGQQGSVLDVYGGEYEWDRFTVKLYNQRGNDSGAVIRYGKNLTGLNQEGDISGMVTGICPYWYSDGTLVMCDPPIIYRDGMTAQSAATVDFTTQFEEAPTAGQLQEAAEKYIDNNDIGKLTVSIEIEFIQLDQMSGFEGMALLEKCDLCDTVTVQYEQAGIDVNAEVVSIQTDVLLERYEKMEIGSIRANIAQTIADQQAQITQNKQDTVTFLQQAVQNATGWITGGKGGYVIFQLNANGQPEEILILDQPSIETAQNVWRWNKGGFGHSSNGYNGPYTTAITQDGAIVADFITAGTMLANIIKGGTLTLGGAGNGNGTCQILDANGNVVVSMSLSGITATAGKIGGWNIGTNELTNQIGNNKVTIANGSNQNMDFLVVETKDQNGNTVYPFWVRANGQVGINLVDQSASTPAFTIGNIDGAAIRMGGDGFEVDFGQNWAKMYYLDQDGAVRLSIGNGDNENIRLDSDGMIQTKYPIKSSASPNVHMNSSGAILECTDSTRRIKNSESEDLGDMDPEALYRLPVKTYKYNDGYLSDKDPRCGQRFIGFMAEDMEEVYPYAVDYDDDGLPRNWNIRVMVPAMIKLIQRNHEKLTELEGKINDLMSEYNGRSV